MGMITNDVAYQFGQMGSAYTDVAKPIIPPQGMVICAIQFLTNSTPTTLTPEKLDGRGPGFASISGTTSDVVMAADEYMNFNGLTRSTCTNGTYAAGAAVTITAENTEIQVGQYVLLVTTASHEGVGLTIDAETPSPIYSGPNKRGVYVTAYSGGTDTLELSAQITPSSQDLIFLGPQQGAGGITAAGQQYPTGLTIYGRWTEFLGEDAKGVICYFGY